MKKIFVLIAYGGEYDDAWENAVATSFDREKLVTLQADLEIREPAAGVNRSRMETHMAAWANSYPETLFPIRQKVPALPARAQDITEEMLAERKKITNDNLNIDKQYQDAHIVWSDSYISEQKRYLLATFSAQEINDIDYFTADTCAYTINAIDFLE